MQKYLENELMMIDVGREPRGALRRKCIIEAVINLVRYDGDAGIFGASDQIGERRRSHHRSGRIGGRADHHALERPRAMMRQELSLVIDQRVVALVSMQTGSQPRAVRIWR